MGLWSWIKSWFEEPRAIRDPRNEIPALHKGRGIVVGIFGCAGSGKTLFAVKRCLGELPRGVPAIVYDREGDVTAYLNGRGVEVTNANECFKVVKPYRGEPGIAIFRGKKQLTAFLETIALDWVKRMVLFLDESEDALSDQDAEHDEQETLIRVARNRGNEVTFTAQRPQGIATVVRARCDFVYALKQNTTMEVRALAHCAEHDLWIPTLTFGKHECLVKLPYREHFDTPLLHYKTSDDELPIPHRLKPDALKRWMEGPPKS